MQRYELWQQQYRARRYMEHLAPAELEQLAKDVFLNFLVLTDDAKIGAPPPNPTTLFWLIQWTHVLEELATRNGPYPGGFTNGFMKNVTIPDPRSPMAPKAAAAVRKHKEKLQSPYLVKYGKLPYVRAALERGAIRVSPATFYKDPSLNHAARDDELELSMQIPPSEIRMEVLGKTGAKKGEFTPTRNVTLRQRSETNYYVYCLSQRGCAIVS